MDKKYILELSGRDLDCAIAEHIFKFKYAKTPYDIDGKFGGEDYLIPPNLDIDSFIYPPRGRIGYGYHVPDYHTLEKVFNLENMILNKGYNKQLQYFQELADITKETHELNHYFSIVHSSLEEKLKAILITLKEN